VNSVVNTEDRSREAPDAFAAIEAAEHGGRQPQGLAAKILFSIAILWSLFQLWIASPVPFALGFGVFNDTEARSIHLAFALFLVYLSFPRRRGRIEQGIPKSEWLVAAVAAGCALYLFLFYDALASRAGDPTVTDVVIAAVGVLLLLEATRRALGWPLTIIAACFLFYTFAGPWLPDLMAHKGASLERVASHQWLTTEGVFGVAIGVSAGFVFLFVLFGSMLEQAGGGSYFIRLAFSLVGHMRGGPAKAGVLASGLTGMVSGSSIANVVTTGTFTIPLMKKVGFPGHRAGAIEVAASTNGQIMPPVMGAAAFLMVEYLNISYLEVIKHAFLPALLSYCALMYLVHLEAVKANMQGLPRPDLAPRKQRMLRWGISISGLLVFFYITWRLLDGLTTLFGDYSLYANGLLIGALYLGVLYWEARRPEPEWLDPEHIPNIYQALRGGLHFLLPIVVLVWCLTVLRLSPATAVFYAILLMVVILLTQRPLKKLFAGEVIGKAWRGGFDDLIRSLREGARNMMGIGVATATAGIVVGTVSLTGIGQVLGELIETLSMGSVIMMFLLTALVCMVLGMGLPTTANYIVVSTLMAPVIVQFSAAHGLEIPLVAVHLFVFYFGILADDTPPVGLAAYAASGISGADPIRTGVQSFFYDIRTAILPFMFIFNTELLMIGVDSVSHVLLVASTGLAAMLLFAAATQGWFITRSRWWESLLLLLVVFSLFRPDYWRDQFFPPFQLQPAIQLPSVVQQLEPQESLRLKVEIENEKGKMITRTLLLPVPDSAAEDRLQRLGFVTEPEGDTLRILDIGFLSPAENAGLEAGFAKRILGFERRQQQPAKEWFLLPPLLLCLLIGYAQVKRKRRTDPTVGMAT
jgi:TRAP transporter 4TM/12TM fusion protein